MVLKGESTRPGVHQKFGAIYELVRAHPSTNPPESWWRAYRNPRARAMVLPVDTLQLDDTLFTI